PHPSLLREDAMSSDAVETDLPATVRIGTRGSPLARWQAGWVADRLREAHPGLEVVLVEIKTQGDRDRNSPLSAIGGLGLFTKEIQRALAESAVEVAVHSLKDLPTSGPEGLTLGAVPPREELADALIAPEYRTLEALPGVPRSGPARSDDRAHCSSPAPTCGSSTSEGTWRPAWTRRSGDPGRRGPGRGGAPTPPPAPPRHAAAGPPGSSPRWGRGPWASNAAPPTRRPDACWPRWTTRHARAVLAERAALAELEGAA
ncbi:MAG: hydroxymethylbilane synthase, partial [Singulisphaera sp.]